jgi:hypothetical protein
MLKYITYIYFTLTQIERFIVGVIQGKGNNLKANMHMKGIISFVASKVFIDISISAYLYIYVYLIYKYMHLSIYVDIAA